MGRTVTFEYLKLFIDKMLGRYWLALCGFTLLFTHLLQMKTITPTVYQFLMLGLITGFFGGGAYSASSKD